MTNLKIAQKRFKLIKKLRESRYTMREIGSRLSISKQRVSQIITCGFPTKALWIGKKPLSKFERYLRSIKQNGGRQRAREMVRIRDNYTCQDCGKKILTKDIYNFNRQFKTNKGRKKSLDVHHINGQCGKNSTGYDSVKDLSGMITLCHKCHYNRPEHRVHSKEFGDNLSKVRNGMKYKKKVINTF